MPCRRQRSPCGGDWGKPEASCGGYRGEPESPPRRRPRKPVAPPRRRLGEAGSPRGGYRGEPESLLRRRLREAESLLWRRLGKPEAYCSGGWGNRKLPVVEIGETGSPLRRRQVFARVAKGGRPRKYKRRQGKPIAPPRRRLGKPEPPRRRQGNPVAPCGRDRGTRKPPAAETGLCPRGKGRTAPGIQFACMAKEGQPRGYKRIFDGDLRARRAVGAAGRGTTGRRGTSGGGVWRPASPSARPTAWRMNR